jgi:16S rRNA (uracil1498-N3)-methyltransferase
VTTTALPVFLVDKLPSGAAVLDGPEGRHAATVRRLRAGEQLLLTDGRGGLARCSVAAVEGSSLRLDVTESWQEPVPSPRVVVVQALVKGDRGELAVELATEAGADVIVPWRASRCVARWDDGPRGAKALERWRATVRSAAKQARRAWVPEVAEPVATAGLSSLIKASSGALVLDAAGSSRLAEVELPGSGDLIVVVGPEGGITDEELTALTAAGAHCVRLGNTVLRASTAAAVTLGALGVLTRRWLV